MALTGFTGQQESQDGTPVKVTFSEITRLPLPCRREIVRRSEEKLKDLLEFTAKMGRRCEA
jgi:hypothetical protein